MVEVDDELVTGGIEESANASRYCCVIKGRRLAATQPAQQVVIDSLLADAFAGPQKRAPSYPVALRRPHGQRPILMSAIPVSGRQPSTAWPHTDRGVLVVIADSGDSGVPAPVRSFQLLSLTAAEARVAVLLGQGISPEKVAETLALSVGTVRNHLKQIYAKLDIERQGQLVQLASRLALLG